MTEPWRSEGFYSSGAPLDRGGYYSSMSSAGSSLPAPDDVEWADYAKSVMGGGASLVQATGWLTKVLGAEDVGSSIETLGRDAVDFWHDSLSDPAKAEISKQIIRKNDQGEYEWGDASFSTVGLMGAQSLLGTAAGMGTGAGLTKVLQVFANPFGRQALVRAATAQAAHPGLATTGITQAAKKLRLVDTVLGAGGFGVGEGAVGGISAGASVYDNIMNLPVEKLLENERYAQVYNSTDETISELERHQYAADTVAKEASTAAGWQSGLTTALMGAPMGAYFGRILGGARLQSTIPKAVVVGAAGEAAQEFGQSGVEQLISNYQTGKFDPDVDLWEGVLNAAVSGAAAGGLLGGMIGPAAVRGSRAEIDMQQREQVIERVQILKKIGGPMNAATVAAAEAKVEPAAVSAIVNDWTQGRIDMSRALDSLEALTEARQKAEETGEQFEVEAPMPAPADIEPQKPSEAAGEAPAEPEPSPAPTAVGPEAQPEAEKAPIPEAAAAPELEMVNLLDTKVDAPTFQFKGKTDEKGVTGALKGVKKFDKVKAGVAIIYEDMNGERFVVDAHQRKNLADTLFEAGKQPREDFEIPAYVLKASEGVTPEEATLVAALKNVAEGTGSAIDAAKVMRQIGPEGAREMPALPPRSAVVKQAKGLTNLDEDAWAKAVNEVIPQEQAAIVGEMIVEDGALQNAAIEVLRQTNPANATQARAIVGQVRTVGTETKVTEDLFGEQALEESLYLERAKVLDAALRSARRDKAVFRTLTNREAIIAQTGENVLDTPANLARMTESEQAVAMLSTLANQKGPISDALTEAAREVKAGKKPGTVAQGFLAAAVAQIQTGGETRGKPRQARPREPTQEVAEALYSRAGLQNRPIPQAAMAELERRIIDPVQTGELNPEDYPGAGPQLLVAAVNLKDQTISLPEENKASMQAIANTLIRVVSDARNFRYNEGWRARIGLYGKGPGFGPGRETYEQMSNGINALQNLRDAVQQSASQAPTSRETQDDMFAAPPAAPEPAPAPAEPQQQALFSRAGTPLDDITLMREVEVEETGERFEVEQNAGVLLRQLNKRISVVEKLRGCVRG